MTPKQLIRTYLREEYGLSDYQIRKKLNKYFTSDGYLYTGEEDENYVYIYEVDDFKGGEQFHTNIDRFMRWNVRRQRYLKIKKIQNKI